MPDILIRGVEAPTSCEGCKDFFLREYDFPCYRARCGLGGTVPPYPLRFEKRGDDCPILELPPHGDLIDRDDIVNAEKAKPIAKMMLFGGKYVIDLDVVRDAPVVVPAERSGEDDH